MSRTRKVLDTEKLAVAVRTRRGSRSIRQTAEDSGLDFSLLQRTEKGDSRPSMDNLIALCDWLDLPVDYFITERRESDRNHAAAA